MDEEPAGVTPPPVGDQRVLTLLELNSGTVPTVDLPAPGPMQPALPPPGPEETSANASRYVELDLIGRGGLGDVVAVFDQDLRRTVALKRPRFQHGNTAGVTRLVEEAQITAQLEHPNIPSVHTLGIDAQGRPYFTMTRIDGISLAELMKQRETDEALRAEFTTARLVRIVLQVGYALAFAHARGVLHRDLKPDNVMLGRFGEVRLMDWGLAKVLGRPDAAETEGTAVPAVDVAGLHDETRAGQIMGTPGYMSPEQADGGSGLDERCDVYALGALLYRLLAGRPPITGKNMAQILLATVRGDIPSLDTVSPANADLCAITHRALATKREDRYPSILEMVRDLEAVLEGRQPPSKKRGALSRLAHFYVSRNARVARLRTADVDWMCGGTWLLGMAMAIWCQVWFQAAWWPWVFAVVGVIGCIPGTYAMMRRARPEDPGHIGALAEGVREDRALVSHSPHPSWSTPPATSNPGDPRSNGAIPTTHPAPRADWPTNAGDASTVTATDIPPRPSDD